jgi:sugar phosphate isomerase/epimerase
VNFDVGHWHAYSQAPLGAWLERLGARLFSVHLHDNRGGADEHLALGRGAVPWDQVFAQLRALGRPLEWTIENRSLADVLASAAFLGRRAGVPELEGLAGLEAASA